MRKDYHPDNSLALQLVKTSGHPGYRSTAVSLSTNCGSPTSADSHSYRSLLILATARVAPALASLLALLPISRPRLGSLCWIPLTIAVALVLTSLWRLAITRRPLRNKHKHSRSSTYLCNGKKGNGSPYSITKHRVLELIPVLDNQPAGDVSHKPGGRLSLLSARPAVTPATLKRADTNFATLWTEVQWVWTVCLRLLPDSIVTAIWTQALLHLSPAS